mgnify:FL=1
MPAPRRDLQHTQRLLEQWLAQRLGCPGEVEVSRLRGPTETGYSSDTLLFDAEVRRGKAKQRLALVARLQPRGMTVFPEYDMQRQYRLLQWLHEQGTVPVPKALWYEGSPEALGTPFFVMEFVEGRVPSDNPPYHITGWLHELSAEERRELWLNGLQAMAAVHALDASPLIGSLFPAPPPGATWLESQLDEYRRFIHWGLVEDRYPLLKRAERWLRAHAPRHETPRLCWGDSRIGNQLFRGTQCVALLDWEMARVGDPEQDLAWYLALDRCFSEGLGVEPLPGLGLRSESVALWERTSGLCTRNLEYYEVLALYKFSAIMARVIVQLKHYEVFPLESDMDIHNLASLTLEHTLASLGW